MTHLQNLNNGLEMKIIELQLRLDKGERERMAAQDVWNNQKMNYQQVYIHTVYSGRLAEALSSTAPLISTCKPMCTF